MCAIGGSSKTSVGGDASASTLLGSLSIGGSGAPAPSVAAARGQTLLTSPFGRQTAAPGAPGAPAGGGSSRRPPHALY